MNNKDNPEARTAPQEQAKPGGEAAEQPQWADSLRNMYESVVDEPIPDSFKDLLAQLDEPKKGSATSEGGQ